MCYSYLSGVGTRLWSARRLRPLLAMLLVFAELLTPGPTSIPAYAADPTFAFPDSLGDGRTTKSVALGDFNGDGALDVVLGNGSEPSEVYFSLNDRTDSFAAPIVLPNSNANTWGVAVGDLDGDGDLDLVLGNFDGPSQVYLNTGVGGFATPTALPGTTGGIHNVAVGDLNGDGAFDIVLTSFRNSLVYLNNGTGGFGQPAILPDSGFVGNNDLALGDLNNDGALDLVLDTSGQVYLNDGTGSFRGSASLGGGSGVAIGDLNDDGALDVVFGEYNFPGRLYLNMNDGTGSFQAPTDLPGSSHQVTSVALGDLNGDGALDLVFGDQDQNGPSQIYLNSGAGSFGAPVSLPGNSNHTQGLAIGDLNRDGLLDLVLGKFDQPSQIYVNAGISSFGVPITLSTGGNGTTGVTMGDFNGDDALDVVLGNQGQPSQVYLNTNDRTGGFGAPTPLANSGPGTRAVAVGDLNADGALDLVLGNSGSSSQVYFNDRTGGFSPPALLPGSGGNTYSVVMGDLNGDAALDLVLGNQGAGQFSQVYFNIGAGSFKSPVTLPDSGAGTTSVALGDLNGDNALDLVLGNFAGFSQVYLNSGAGAFTTPVALSSSGTGAYGVAIGDLNGDGALDVALAKRNNSTLIYLNNGTGSFGQPTALPGSGNGTTSIAIGDVNGDSRLDLLLGNTNYPGQVYLGAGSGRFGIPATLSDDVPNVNNILGMAVGDLNGDGALDLVLGQQERPSQVYLNGLSGAARLPNNPPAVAIIRPGPTHNANFYSTPAMLSDQIIPISFRLFDPEDDPVRFVRAFYSLDGGDNWQTAIATDTITTDLQASRTGSTHTFNWDTFASGFFGQSDNVVFRIEAYTSLRPSRSGTPGPYQRPYASATTFPFRARGTLVQVLDGSKTGSPPTAGALVYRLPAGQSRGAQLFPALRADQAPFRTDSRGFLQGRGELNVRTDTQAGDRLVALLPVAPAATDPYSDSYALYFTSAAPTDTGVDAAEVVRLGVQQLTVSDKYPLILFHLTISLEWDARADVQYMNQLRFDLQRASELLYDWSNGQAALGDLTIYHDKEQWDKADIQIFAGNRLRPNASQGGIVNADTADVANPQVVYEHGEVRIGATWNRFGDSGGALGEDWPRTLAHELGHFALFLDDNYLGLDAHGRLISVDGCPGAMSDPYRDDYSEFHPSVDWLPACAQTLSQQETGRSDWATITTFYPALHPPATPFSQTLAGPSILPLAVTRILPGAQDIPPLGMLESPLIALTDRATGGRYLPSASARAFLFSKGDSRLTDLGRPTFDQVLARGARRGNELCVYDLAAGYLGCEQIHGADTQLALGKRADWRPDVQITPVTSPEPAVIVSVSGVANAPSKLIAKLFPEEGTASPTATLELANGVYTGRIRLQELDIAGALRIWVEEDTVPRRELVTDYALGGNPATRRRPRRRSRRRAPALSADGQVVLFGNDLNFPDGTFYTIQAATSLPPAPPWTTVVGQGYRLFASPGAPPLIDQSINISYMEDDLQPGTEGGIGLYFWNDTAKSWNPIADARLDSERNEVSATVRGPGLYALMTSVDMRPGWNLFSYPWVDPLPVTDALKLIGGDGYYTTVYGYDEADADDPWKVYDVDAPRWVSDLQEMHYGRGYWINVTGALAASRTAIAAAPMAVSGPAGSLPNPPATYFGIVPGAMPGDKLAVEAYVNDNLCGQAETLSPAVTGESGPAFVIDVLAAGSGDAAGCGTPGAMVTLVISRGKQEIWHISTTWDNGRVHNLRIAALYLPLVASDGADQ